MDGLGGSLKRTVRQQVISRKAMVKNAQDFAEAGKSSKISIVVVTPEDITGQKAFLDERWDQTKTLHGTRQLHFAVADGQYSIRHARYYGEKVSRFSFVNGNDSHNSSEAETDAGSGDVVEKNQNHKPCVHIRS